MKEGINMDRVWRSFFQRSFVAIFVLVLAFSLLSAGGGEGAMINEEYVEYLHEGAVLEGFVCYDESMEGIRPGVIVISEWTGINEYTLERCRMLAEFGYVAFAADIYGKGVRPSSREEASRQATIYRSDRPLMRARINAALAEIRKHPMTDTARIATIGYCFGGGAALEHARSGADILGAVSFHGNLDTPDPKDAEKIKASILVLHGASDPLVPMSQVESFRDEMDRAGVDWQLVMYGGAVHSFTNPSSGSDPSGGVAYDQLADIRSWEAMMLFFEEIFE